MKIFLIGLPGSGKTTVGRKLAAHLKSGFIDLDEEIIRKEGRTIKEIFESNGESYFREIERDVLRECAEASEQFVMATGGGAPAYFNNMELMNSLGITVLLNVPIEVLAKRLTEDKARERPLFDGAESFERKLQQLYAERRGYYARAKLEIQSEVEISELANLLSKK